MTEQTTARAARITPRTTLTATAVLWPAALTLFAWHLIGGLPLGALGTDLWCAWLLALGCVGFWTTFLRVTEPLLAEDWRVGVALGDLNHLPLGEPSLDPLFAPGRARGFVRESLWPVFGWIGGICWGLAAAFTGAIATGHLHPHPSDALLALTVIMVPAVQCTAAAINGPPLSRQHAIRKAAGLAHQRLREQRGVLESAAALDALDADGLRRLARTADMLADGADERREPLHLVEDAGQRRSQPR